VLVPLCVVLLALSGVLTTGTSAAAQEDSAAIQELLDRRAAAVRERDRGAFAATIAPGAGDFRTRQLQLFKRMAGLDLTDYRLILRWDRLGDLARQSDQVRYPDAESVSIPLTEERYRLTGFDREDAVEEMFYTFVDYDGEWFIASDTDLEDIAFYSARHPWDYSRLQTDLSGHFLLLEPSCKGCSKAPPSALVLAETALARVKKYWTAPWRKRMPLVIPNTSEDLKRMLQLTFDVDNFVAFASSTVDFDQGLDYTGHRIILNPDQFIGRPSDSTLDILAHEVLHVATRETSGPFVPTWVEEGIAEFVGHDGSTASFEYLLFEVSSGGSLGKIPEQFEFTTGDGAEIYRSYQKSYSAVHYFIQRWGLKSFIRFYRTLGHPEVAPGLPDYHVDKAMRDSIGIGINRFERAWTGSIGNQ
jgi:hypothetical protein